MSHFLTFSTLFRFNWIKSKVYTKNFISIHKFAIIRTGNVISFPIGLPFWKMGIIWLIFLGGSYEF